MAIKKILVANRSEIAIRVFRAANELGLKTVAVWTKEDKLALHRFKADEAYQIGTGPHLQIPMGPIESYLSIQEILRVTKLSGADAIHPGYGLLSESPEFVDACEEAGITFIGPKSETMRVLGNKLTARNLALSAGVPVLPATSSLPNNIHEIKHLATEMGYPVMLKASWGGGGRGMRIIRSENDLERESLEARREAQAAFNKDEIYLEKLVEDARHVEVQILGDTEGNAVHLFERDCSVQRRNQKVVERAPAPYLDETQRRELCEYALKIAKATNYIGAGTVEFLMDINTRSFYFIEVNPRVQVEHTVTEEVTGIDIIKAQIHLVAGYAIGSQESGIPKQCNVRLNGHALQCRITTEDPERNFIPDYGRITAYRGATGFGVRLDGGTAYSGAVITRFYDPLLEKVTAWAPTPQEAIKRMDRALREFRIRGVSTNLTFLENIITHPKFNDGTYTTKFIDTTSELFEKVKRRDRATRLLNYIADVSINGHPETRNRQKPELGVTSPDAPWFERNIQDGTRNRLDAHGPKEFSKWMRNCDQVLISDTTMRDAHQSLLATRMRTYDIIPVAASYAKSLPQLLSLECWGGATFDVAMRFMNEDPWERLMLIREQVPNILLQALVRGSNGVGYTGYPDNIVSHFISEAAKNGIDLFRVFDCLNWVENMRVSIDSILESGKLCEAAICYTGDVLDKKRPQYNLDYYLKMVRSLDQAGAHIICIKDMAGLMKPAAARQLFPALRKETDLPIHFHTHDTSGISAATVLAAVEAGVDAIDAAMDSLSGNASQPCLGSIVEALKNSDRDSGLDGDAIRKISLYWESVRAQYLAFESNVRSPASDVYVHEMPGGQYTNLKEQARSLNLGTRWNEIAKTYAEVNDMFGDIVKVTPSSKVVGDMALMMVSQELTRPDVEEPKKDIDFPDSVLSLMRGNLGIPPNGWPKLLQKKVLKGEQPLMERPGASMPLANLSSLRKEAEEVVQRQISDTEFVSYLMYPKVFTDYAYARREYGPTSTLPTLIYFYGMQPGDEITIEIEKGKLLVVHCLAYGEIDKQGMVTVFFELNGQPRRARVPDRVRRKNAEPVRPKADLDNPSHISSPIPGVISMIMVEAGQYISAGDVLLSIEAMKMETVLHAEKDGKVAEVLVRRGDQVDAKDLLIRFE
ncbi:pyruvate carboxylase [Candidatus Endowatersipora endosymbiont of Watersipora subatra]|uniref:pyruvate carboxylase n=1 Tax=Candidatus Endowatersipora endosymbiont of Watersipora subatra TaxID=3077946 RepID=UPI00312C8705